MSGTSLDGLDMAYVEFSCEDVGKWNYKILEAETIPYSEKWYSELRSATKLGSEDLLELHSRYGFYLGEQVKNFREKHKIESLDVIASHGQTVFHQPNRRFTLQIGEGRAIQIENPFPVVYDFRTMDVILGGEGAPFVPIGDELLFRKYDACLNLGGFSNISFNREGKRIAFDICPVAVVLNELAGREAKPYDQEGAMAREGKINSTLLEQLNRLDFYKTKGPKSLGAEWVQSHVTPLLTNLSTLDLLSTYSEHVALQIAEVLNSYEIKEVLITGGSSYNEYLIERIKAHSSTLITIPSSVVIEYKEALIFAFMAVLRLRGEVNVLSSVTGALRDHCTGILIP